MLDWMKRVTGRGAPLSVVPASERGTRGGTGRYGRLRDYLEDRHADRVVLTFKEIEDLLGFALPEDALRPGGVVGQRGERFRPVRRVDVRGSHRQRQPHRAERGVRP